MSKYIDAEKLLEKEKALLKRLMAFRNALAGEEANYMMHFKLNKKRY